MVDAIQRVAPKKEKAREVAAAKLDAHYTTSYGIFGGRPTARAVLRFTPERARWVRAERWHGVQQGELLADGGYRLTPPVSYFFSESRISRSSNTSSAVGAGAGGGASFFSWLICLTMMKMTKARMMKLIATVMKLP